MKYGISLSSFSWLICGGCHAPPEQYIKDYSIPYDGVSEVRYCLAPDGVTVLLVRPSKVEKVFVYQLRKETTDVSEVALVGGKVASIEANGGVWRDADIQGLLKAKTAKLFPAISYQSLLKSAIPTPTVRCG